ncbi:MAG TPA: LptF/LptG family permease [Arcobacter sp.]|nr:LptF/LptG family permease [Arcobacter sp.]HIP56027.1 LptF/LptG family permease [Arcobacter sp.]
MKIITKYLLNKYLKYFFIILISLELFFIGFDYLQQMGSLPASANLQLLYLLYNGFFILTITLPLSIVFAWLVTITFLIKENTLVSFYSLGVSKVQVIVPILLTSSILTFILILLQTTPLAYSYEQKSKILKNQFFVNEKSHILLKYNDNFVYFEKLYPLEKKATNIRIFKVKDNQLLETIIAKKAYYQNKKWYVIDAKIITRPENLYWDESKLTITYEKFLYTLEAFKPEIINNVYKSKVQYSISDAIYTILLFQKQNLSTNKIKGILYSKVFVPFFVVPLIILIFVYSDISGRFFKIGQFISIGIASVLILWGILFLLQKIAVANIVNSELALLVPLFLLFSYAWIQFERRIL